MRDMNNIKYILLGLIGLFLVSCQSEDNFPGREYMPDMKHSIAYEANYYDYYSLNTWGTEEEYYEYAKPRLPVKHTIPIGDAGTSLAPSYKDQHELIKSHQGITVNGYVPFDYENTEDERNRASSTILRNPIPITTAGMARGSELYNIYCGICHGAKGDGNGYLIRDGSPYPAQPANLINEEFTNASSGRFYFALMHGKNVMGGYSDKLSYEERWQVIHYIRSLQAKEQGKEYSETSNTLNNYAKPYSLISDSLKASLEITDLRDSIMGVNQDDHMVDEQELQKKAH